MPPVAIPDLPDAHVRVIDGDRVRRQRNELQPVELAGRPEHGIAHRVQLQVGLDFIFIEVVAGLADLLGVVPVVPGLDGDVGAFRVGDRLHVGDFLADPRHGGRPDRLHQLQRPLGRLGHRVLQAPVGVSLEAEQLRALGAQREDLGDDGIVVVGVALVAAIDEAVEDPAPQVAACRVGQEGLDARARIQHDPLARHVAFRRRRRGAGEEAIRQTGEVRLAFQHHEIVFLVGQHVLAEVGEQRGQALVDRGDLFLFLGSEPRTRQHQVGVAQPDNALLLRRQPGLVGRVVEGLDAPEQRFVLDDPVPVCCQARRHPAFQRLELLRAQAGAVDAVNRADAVQAAARALERRDGVVEGRDFRTGRDRVDFRQFACHGGLQGRLQQTDAGQVKRRDAAVRAGPGREERVRRLGSQLHGLVRLGGRCAGGERNRGRHEREGRSMSHREGSGSIRRGRMNTGPVAGAIFRRRLSGRRAGSTCRFLRTSGSAVARRRPVRA